MEFAIVGALQPHDDVEEWLHAPKQVLVSSHTPSRGGGLTRRWPTI